MLGFGFGLGFGFQAPKAKPRPKPSKVKAAMKRPSASSAAGEDGANPEAESKSAMKRPSASPADGANLEPMSEAEASRVSVTWLFFMCCSLIPDPGE